MCRFSFDAFTLGFNGKAKALGAAGLFTTAHRKSDGNNENPLPRDGGFCWDWSLDQSYHPAPVYSVERVQDVVPIEHC